MRKATGIKALAVLLLVSGWVSAFATSSVKTPAEVSRFTRYSQHEEISRFLSVLDQQCAELTVKVVGRTLETREYGSKDLYLCILSEEKADRPSGLDRRKPTLMVIAAQHGNEQSAKEAALAFVRDLALGDIRPLLKRINVLVIPQANPYGTRFDQRRNEQGLDLNRDHVKLESPEVEAIHRVFRAWMPEVTLDLHEKGDDFYRVSIGCVSNPNISPLLQRFSREHILEEVGADLERAGIPFHEYLVTQRMGIDSSAGVQYRRDEGSEETMKRFSTTDLNDGRNSLGIYETLSFIQEGASRHDIQTLEERTRWQSAGIRSLARSVSRHAGEIVELVRGLRSELLQRASFLSSEDIVHLRMEYARDERRPVLTIKTFEDMASPVRGVLRVDKKAGDVITARDLDPYPYPARRKVVEVAVENWFPLVRPTLSVPRPLGYVLPADRGEIVETLLKHRIEIMMFTEAAVLEVESYRVRSVVPSAYDYLPPQQLEVDKESRSTIVAKNSFFVSCAQAAANLIPALLEPQSQYGLIRYWKFGLVPEAGDIYPIYRVLRKGELPLVPYRNWDWGN